MTQAWQLRESEQQEFVQGLAREVRDAADAFGNYELYIIEFLIAILTHFRFEIDWERVMPKLKSIAIGPACLLEGAVARIAEFARVESERRRLLYMLFKELEPTVASWAQREYGSDQIFRQQEVFGAASATAELEED